MMFEHIAYTINGVLPALGWCGWGQGGAFWGHGPGMMGWLGPFGMVFGAFFWIAVIALVVWGFWRLAARPQKAAVSSELPADVLKRRLAAGEITTDEYMKIKKTIDDKK